LENYSFTDDVIDVGGASLVLWMLWEELHWWWMPVWEEMICKNL